MTIHLQVSCISTLNMLLFIPLEQFLTTYCDSVNTCSTYYLCELNWKEDAVSFFKNPFTQLGGPKKFNF